MIIHSNLHFWGELRRSLQRLIPHCDEATYKSYSMLLRTIQAIMYSSDTLWHDVKEPYSDNAPHVTPGLWETHTYRRFWHNTVSGVQYEIEWVRSNIGAVKTDGVFVVTTEDWEAVISFDRDTAADVSHSMRDTSYFLMEALLLKDIQIEGDVESLHRDMFLAAFTVADIETGEIFFNGDPL